jgi:EAL domain-containing protein (putative c-di-GMP-specific phosphodiesterase class I)
MVFEESESHRYLLESWLELRDALDSHPEVRRLLFDPVTGLPTTPLLFPRIEALMEDRGEVSLLCLNVVKYSRIEEIYGWRVFDEVMRHVATALESITGQHLRDSDIVAELMIAGNSFVIVLSPPRNTLHIDDTSLASLSYRVEELVTRELQERIAPELYAKFGCYVGASTIKTDENTRLERLVYDGLDAALTESQSRETEDSENRQRRLAEIIEYGQVRTLVHPVFRISDLSIIGYEALTRGPEGGEFERPDKLFKVAYDGDLVLKLERLCRQKALEAAKHMPDDRILFLNIEPDAVNDPQLRDITFSTLVADSSLTPESIVLEITERTAIIDFVAFRQTLEYLRAIGFSVAVDDAGAGYGSLQCLAEVRPEWVKIDLSLVRSCDTDPVRLQLISSLVDFANSLDVRLVAEGIETKAEFHALREAGVEYGQGFLFTQPVPPFPEESEYDLEGLLE